MTVEARVELGKLASRFSDPRFASQMLADEYATLAKDRILAAIKKETPIGKHFDLQGNDGGNKWGTPGELRDSMYALTYHVGGNLQIAIKSKKEQARYVTGGTKPHTISVNSAPYLQFWWEKMGNDFPIGMWEDGSYTGPGTQVNHPGSAPNQFTKRAWASIRATELALFKKSVLKQLGL